MILFRVGWRHLTHHPWQAVLMIIGIMLGVAVAVAIDLANTSASRAFDLSTEAVAGKATHQIIAGQDGFDEAVYLNLRKSGLIKAAAPVLSEYVSSPQLGSRPLQLLGVDVFVEQPFRDYLSTGRNQAAEGISSATRSAILNLTEFLTAPGAILLADNLVDRYGLTPGQEINLLVQGRSVSVRLAGILQPNDSLSRRAMEGLIIADIATAQEIAGRIGKIDRIDLILPPDPHQPCSSSNLGQESCLNSIQAMLPPGLSLQEVETRSGTIKQMTSAFRINLTALSLLALVVGMFLIYNTITFSVVQRRDLIGTLRCLGVTRREIFSLVILEALIVGLIGSILGVILGIILGQGAVRLVTQTINDLFFILTIRGVQIPLESLIKGLLLGIITTLLTAAPPAWEAASVPPRIALSRSGLEGKARSAIRLSAILGSLSIISGIILLAVQQRDLVISFAGTFSIIVGFAMLTPFFTRWLMEGMTPGFAILWGTLGRMAPRDVVKSLSRTSIAVMALMVAVSVTIGVNLMVNSFRYTVVAWLDESLQGDIYISNPGLTANTPTGTIAPSLLDQLRSLPEISRIDVLRAVNVESPNGTIQISATDNSTIAYERLFLSLQVKEDEVWREMLGGGVLVSEPLANRLGLSVKAGPVTLFTDQGPRQFPVLGVYSDYASTQGSILMALPLYQRNWEDENLSAIALRLKTDVAADPFVRMLQDEISANQNLLIRSNQALRDEVLVVFDRTFAITSALQLLATLVAFIGILSALLSLELERQREIGILRSIGLSVKQLFQLILLETGLMGFVAGILALPTGFALAWILVYIINRRSFGWTLQMEVTLEPFLTALFLAIIAALIAGIYPAFRMGRMLTSEAIRSD